MTRLTDWCGYCSRWHDGSEPHGIEVDCSKRAFDIAARGEVPDRTRLRQVFKILDERKRRAGR